MPSVKDLDVCIIHPIFFWLIQELAGTFGEFQMDWRELGVPRRGGVIVESFNADEVDYLYQNGSSLKIFKLVFDSGVELFDNLIWF